MGIPGGPYLTCALLAEGMAKIFVSLGESCALRFGGRIQRILMNC